MRDNGKVYKEAAQRWVADFAAPDGKRMRRVRQTRPAALRALADMRRTQVAVNLEHGPTVRQVLDAYGDQLAARARPRSEEKCRRDANVIERAFGRSPAAHLTTRDIDRFVAHERQRGLRPTSINSRLRLLKSALRAAVDAGDLDGVPCRIKLLREAKRMPSVLTDEEVHSLIDAAPLRLQVLLDAAIMTGMRRSELVHLQWRDWQPGVGVRVESKPEVDHVVKDHQDRLVPTNPRLDQMLTEHRARLRHRGPDDWVFQRFVPRGSRWGMDALTVAVRQVFQRAGLWRPGRGLHELRRTATSRMLRSGIDARTVQHILGHSTLMLLERYGSVGREQLREAGDVLGRVALKRSESGV